jgi:hypothetical protein
MEKLYISFEPIMGIVKKFCYFYRSLSLSLVIVTISLLLFYVDKDGDKLMDSETLPL